MAGLPDEWLVHAQSDLHFAKIGRADQNIIAGQIGFHAQQAAEKAIKAVLLTHHLDFPLTHDIDDLLAIARKAGISVPLQVRKASVLTPFAIQARYPAPAGMPESNIPQAIKLAESVVRWAKKMKKKGLKK